MNDENVTRVHWSFWLIGALALIWNVMGVVNFFVQMNPDMIDAYRESERAMIEGRPAWATAAFGIAVIGGALGCILLLLRKSASFHVFIVSFIGVTVTMLYTLSIDMDLGTGEVLGIVVLPLLVAAYLIWYSKHVGNKGWIR